MSQYERNALFPLIAATSMFAAAVSDSKHHTANHRLAQLRPYSPCLVASTDSRWRLMATFEILVDRVYADPRLQPIFLD